MDLSVDHLELGPIETNCYIVDSAGHVMVVDPAFDADAILARVAGRPLDVIAITHCHWDHIQATCEVARRTGAEVVVHEVDAAALANPRVNGSEEYDLDPGVIEPTRLVHDGDEIVVGEARFSVLHTPGHTAGSMCLYEPQAKVLLSGDTLFSRGVGRTDLPTGSRRAIVHSCNEKLALLPDDVTVYPGHGPQTTIGAERAVNPLLRARR
jgi:hydroxyacylglutathione hydrolase